MTIAVGIERVGRLLILAFPVLVAPVAAAQATSSNASDPWRLESALDLPDGIRVRGSVRPRYEALGNPFVAARTDDDEFLGLQTLLQFEVDLGSDTGLLLGGELLDSRFLGGKESGAAPGEVNTLEPAQFYLNWRQPNALIDGAKLDLTAGRITMDIGSRRLVARANFRSLLAAFDGVRAVWKTRDSLALSLAYVAPVSREPWSAASAIDNNVSLDAQHDTTRFGVAHIDAPLPGDMRGELYVMDLDEHDGRTVATRNRDLTTLGARLRHAPSTGNFDFDFEYARQTGSQRATSNALDVTRLDHDAEMMHAEVGYGFDAVWSPRLAFQYDYASGDRSPGDSSSNRFDPLFGDRSFEFGPTSIYGLIARTNLSSPGVRLELKPDVLSDGYVMLRDVRLDQARDSLANTYVRDTAGLSGDHVGVQLEGRYRRWLVKDSVRLAVGAAATFEGEFLESAPNATGLGDPLYGYTELTLTF